MESEKIGKRLFICGVVMFLILLPCMGYAAIPQKINHQGYLTNAAGVPVNGTVQVVFSIYNVSVGGSALWTETQNVTVTQGVYNVELGGVTPMGLAFDIPYYLGVRVGSDSEMTPRIVLTSVGYAFRAKTVDSVGSHTHSGADITTGTVSEPRIDGLIARDSEVTAAVNAHATRTDNPHSTTAAQVGAVALNQPSSITTSMITDGQVTKPKLSAAGGASGQVLGTDGTNLVWQNTSAGDITGVTAGTGLSGGGLSGSVTLNVDIPLSLSGSALLNGILSGSNSNSSGFGVLGSTSGSSGAGVYGSASATGAVTNYGGYFVADGNSGRGVYGYASATGSVANYGGYFEAEGNMGRGVYGYATATGSVVNYGGYFRANGNSGSGVYGSASGVAGIGVFGYGTREGAVFNYGGMFIADGDSGTGVFGEATWGLNGTGVWGMGGQYDFYASGPGTNYGSSSSIRWKRNIQEIDGALDKIMTLRGVYFDWDEKHGGKHDMGFIAEEVGKVIPEIVAYEPDRVYATGIDYGAITPMLVQAIKEQQKQIEDLKAQIGELKKRLDGREGSVAGLNARSD